MKSLIASLFLLFAATVCFGAVPSYDKFKGIGGITIQTNPPNGDVIIDGTGIGGTNTGLNAAQVTNIVNAVVNTNVSYTSNYFITYITTIFAYTSNYFNTYITAYASNYFKTEITAYTSNYFGTNITYTSNYFNTLITTLFNTIYEVGGNDTNYVNTASSNNVRVAAGANITVVTNGSAGVTVYTVSGAAGGGGGTNYPPVTRIGTNVAVGTGVRKSLTIQTNISFKLVFDGTPLNGENVTIGVSNTSTLVIYWTNSPGIFDTSVASNVTTFAVPAMSVKWFEFVSSTNLNLGVARWELRSFLGKEVELGAAGGLVMHTNPQNSLITISNRSAGLQEASPLGSVQWNSNNVQVGATDFAYTNGRVELNSLGELLRLKDAASSNTRLSLGTRNNTTNTDAYLQTYINNTDNPLFTSLVLNPLGGSVSIGESVPQWNPAGSLYVAGQVVSSLIVADDERGVSQGGGMNMAFSRFTPGSIPSQGYIISNWKYESGSDKLARNGGSGLIVFGITDSVGEVIGPGDMVFMTAPSNISGTLPGWSARIRIKETGNVSIGGGQNPLAKLDVNGTANSYLLRVDTDALVLTNRNVGIGTANPGSKLTVSGASNNTLVADSVLSFYRAAILGSDNPANKEAGRISFRFGSPASQTTYETAFISALADGSQSSENGQTYLSFGTKAADTVVAGDGLITEKMRITSAGNVSIGTTPSVARLSVKQSSGDSYLSGIHLTRTSAADTWAFAHGGDNNLYIAYANDASGANEVGDFSPKIVIQNSGNVGIKTTAPVSELDVPGTGTFGTLKATNWVGVNAGETNWNGEVSITNSARIGLVNGKAGNTNLVRSIQGGSGIILTNQGTNVMIAIDTSVLGSSVAAPISSVQFNSNGVQQGSAKLVFTNGNLGVGGGRLPTANVSVYRGLAGTAMDLTGSADQTVNDLRVDFNLTNNADAVGTYARLGVQAGSSAQGEEYGDFYVSTVTSGNLKERFRVMQDGTLVQTNDGFTVKMQNGNITASGLSSFIATNVAPFTVTNGASASITNGAQRGLVVLKLAFDDAVGSTPSCLLLATNLTGTNSFGTLSPIVLGAISSITNDYTYPLQPSEILRLTDTSGVGAAVRVLQWKLYEQ